MEKQVSSYLTSLKNRFPVCVPTNKDYAKLKYSGIEKYIYEKLTSRKFRKTSISETLQKGIRAAIGQRIASKRPITFTFATGGFKKRQLPWAPYVEWSEYFTIRFLEELAALLLPVYEPGVHIEFVSNEVDMELLGNYTRKELLAYTTSFNDLIRQFQPAMPRNFSVIYREMRDQFAPGEYEESLKLAKPDLDQLYKDFYAKTPAEQDALIGRSARNYKFSKAEEALTEEEKHEILKNRALLHEMYVRPIWLGILGKKRYIRNDFEIAISTYHCDWGIHYGSCASSTVQFWVGTGVLLEKLGQESEPTLFVPTIYSIEQLKARKNEFISVPITGVEGTNFNTVLLEKGRSIA